MTTKKTTKSQTAKKLTQPELREREKKFIHQLMDENISAQDLWNLVESAYEKSGGEIRYFVIDHAVSQLRGAPHMQLLALERPDLIKSLFSRFSITDKDLRYLEDSASNAMDNAHDMRGDEGWDDQLFTRIFAIDAWVERFGPNESLAELREDMLSQIEDEGLLSRKAVLAQLKKRAKEEAEDGSALQYCIFMAKEFIDEDED